MTGLAGLFASWAEVDVVLTVQMAPWEEPHEVRVTGMNLTADWLGSEEDRESECVMVMNVESGVEDLVGVEELACYLRQGSVRVRALS